MTIMSGTAHIAHAQACVVHPKRIVGDGCLCEQYGAEAKRVSCIIRRSLKWHQGKWG